MKKPFNSYKGGKAGNGTYQQIINLIPKVDVFVDAMVGNGGIFFNLKLPALTVINDIDRSVIGKYDVTGSLTKIIKRNTCYKNIIADYGYNTRCLIYLDPPYKFDTRKSKRKLYAFEWTDQQHIDFLNLIVTAKCYVAISHYPCELYDTMLKGWYTHDFVSMTRKGLRTDRVYMNYPKPAILQDFRYVGSDYRERQRIKRKIARYLKKLQQLPNDERSAILSSVMAEYGDTAAHFLVQGLTAENDFKRHRSLHSFGKAADIALHFEIPKNQINLLDLIEEVKAEKL